MLRLALALFVIFASGCTQTTVVRRPQPFIQEEPPRGADFVEHAKVISAEPIYETVLINKPVRECWDEQVEYRTGGDPTAGAVVGGIAGGVIGNQFGKGAGKAAMTVAGALIGSAIGRDASQNIPEQRSIEDETHCQTVDRYTEKRRIAKYKVTYVYHGKTLVTETDEDPGDTIEIRVAVDPYN